MAHPYLDQGYIDAHISIETRVALGLSSSELTALIESADTDADRALERWGYPAPTDAGATIPADVKDLSLGAFLARALGMRHGVTLTSAEQALVERLAKEWDRVSGLTLRTTDAPGGHAFSSTDVTEGFPQIFTPSAIYRSRW